jgi:hypothetical protein
VSVKLARSLYTGGELVPWLDVNLPTWWHLNSCRVLVPPIPPVPRDGPERVQEIRRRWAFLPMHLRRDDPAFDIGSSAWDTFSRWELRPDRRAGYLGDAEWDHNWEPVVSSKDDDDEDDDNEDDDDDTTTSFPSSCQQ